MTDSLLESYSYKLFKSRQTQYQPSHVATSSSSFISIRRSSVLIDGWCSGYEMESLILGSLIVIVAAGLALSPMPYCESIDLILRL